MARFPQAGDIVLYVLDLPGKEHVSRPAMVITAERLSDGTIEAELHVFHSDNDWAPLDEPRKLNLVEPVLTEASAAEPDLAPLVTRILVRSTTTAKYSSSNTPGTWHFRS